MKRADILLYQLFFQLKQIIMPSAYNQEEYKKEIVKKAIRASKLLSLVSKPENASNFLRKSRLQPRHIDFINNVWQILEQTYPGRGDIQYELTPEYKTVTNTYGSNHAFKHYEVFDKFVLNQINIVIHFPEVTIINSKKSKIDIRDLFVRIPVAFRPRVTKLEFKRLQGLRTTATPTEYQSSFAHSHLPGVAYSSETSMQYHNFCMGDADYTLSQSLLNSSELPIDYDLFQLMLFQIDTYIKWESLEGGPHKRMSNVVDKDADYLGKVDLHTAKSLYSSIVKSVMKNQFKLDFDWKFVDGRYQIVPNEKFETTMRHAIMLVNGNSDYFGYKDETGEFYTPSKIPPQAIKVYPYWIPFRNKKIYLKIDGQVKTRPSFNEEKYLNPKIKEYVKSRLEYQANYASVRKNQLAKQSQVAYS